MIIPIKEIKKKLVENIVFITILVIGLIYLIIIKDNSGIGFIIAFPPWFSFAYAFSSVMFDWKLFQDLKIWIIGSFVVALLASALLFYMDWREGLYFLVAVSMMVGLAVSIVEKVFSIGSGDENR